MKRPRKCAPYLGPLTVLEFRIVNAINTTGEQSCSCQNDQIIAWAVLRRQEGLLPGISEIRYLARRTYISQRLDCSCRLSSRQKSHSSGIDWPSLQIIHANNAFIFVTFLHESHRNQRKGRNICGFGLIWCTIYTKFQTRCEMLVR